MSPVASILSYVSLVLSNLVVPQDSCGGTPDCLEFYFGFPVLEVVATETGPFSLRIGTGPRKDCVLLQGRALGLVYSRFSSAFVIATQEPALEVLLDGTDVTTRYALSGTEMRAAGGSCIFVTSFDGTRLLREEVVAITDRTIGVLSRNVVGPLQLSEFPLPVGETPVAAAIISACNAAARPAIGVIELAVQLSDDTIHVISNGSESIFQIPAPVVDTPWTANAGKDSYVIVFSANAAHVLHSGVLTSIPLIGTYVSSMLVQGQIVAQTSSGPQIISTPGRKIRFGDCSEPWITCGVGGRLGVNVASCNRQSPRWGRVRIDAAEARWATSTFGCNR